MIDQKLKEANIYKEDGCNVINKRGDIINV